QNAKTAPRVLDIIVPEIYITRIYLLKRAHLKYFVWQEKNLKYLYIRVKTVTRIRIAEYKRHGWESDSIL
ncbi:hypothetical protein DPMN_166163, partial [Dreissena polymorpha]